VRFALVSAILLAACGTASTLPPVRFADAPVVTVVNDRVNVAKPPAKREMGSDMWGFEGSVVLPLDNKLSLRDHKRARGVNALDEVPDSTWFTNRGVLTPDQIRIGPSPGDSPELHKPWKIVGGQVGGTSHGLIVEDQRGYRYLLKFDHPGFPEVETAVDVIVDRLVWACGYNVPDDRVVYVRADELIGKHPANLDRYDRDAEGRYRAIVSRLVDGKPIGGPPFTGTRPDDPNDLIPHEQRRDLRGLASIFAWLDAVDVIPGNFLDSWTADSADPSIHYVVHYAIDFGKSLGAMGSMGHDLHRGKTYRFDWAAMTRALFTIGLDAPPYVDRTVVAIPGVPALFDAKSYDPAAWHPDIPFPAFEAADRYDHYWGAKLISRFSREQLRAAVEAARLSDPRAVDYMTDTLYARARKTAAFWFAQVAPLEHFVLDRELCFDDLAGTPATRYTVAAFARDGHALGTPATTTRTCTPVPAGDAYTIVRITVDRPETHASIYVHLVRGRVIGLWRE
jgi:hypothetical protein